jgi:DHA2 family multidrug resistance protein
MIDVTERGPRRILIIIGTMAAALLQTLDSTITNVALPNISGNLGMSQDEGTWVITAYTISAIIVIPITPWLQNRFGRRTYFVVSIIGFTIASMLCGLSGSSNELIFWRAVQGMFGGGLLATAQSILRDTFPPNQLGLSQGIFALGAIMGPALGPPLGGWLVDNYSWNWCFFINVAPGCVSALILWSTLRDPAAPRRMPVDAIGLALLAAGLGTMQYVLTEGEPNYWFADGSIDVAAFVCVAALVLFVRNELGSSHPIVDLQILRNPAVAAGSILAFALGVAIFGASYTLPQFSQGVLDFTPTRSGLLIFIRALPIALLTFPIVRLLPRVDTRIFLAIGFALIATGMWWIGLVTTSESRFWTFAVPLILTGVGTASLFVPLSTAVLGATTAAEGPRAAALVNLSMQLGGSVSVAMLDVLLDRRLELFTTTLGGAVNIGRPAVEQFLQSGGSVAQLAQLVYQQAASLAYADLNYVTAIVCIASAPLILLLRRRRRESAA